jgi:hypothetical protein
VSNRQGSALGLSQSCQQIASIVGISIGAGMTQLFGLQTIYPLVSLLYAASLVAALGLWLSVRSHIPIGDAL